jgi:multidrug efflux pump subunit AcrB
VKGAIAWFARNSVAANLMMLLFVVGGAASIPFIAQKSFPDIDINIVQIGVPYLGAAPEEVEQGVCIRIEEAIQGVEGIDKITSTANEGSCGVSAELGAGVPIDRALAEIKNEVDGITTFPEETEKPIISYISTQRDAIQLALYGPASERALKVLGERVRDDLTALRGVTQVDLDSVRDYEISIEVPEKSLRRHGLTFDDVARAVRRSSLDRPGGAIRASEGEVLLRAKGQAYTGEEFERLVVQTRPDGTRLLLADIATVVDGFSEDEVYARFNGVPGVLVRVSRVGDQQLLDLVVAVKGYLGEMASRLPDNLTLSVWRDGAVYLRDRLDILLRNGRTGFVLVFLVLALFLRLRLAFWVSVGVPISILGTLFMFGPLGISIDVISLFAFILVLGLLVDDAIVVGENVHRHQQAAEEPLEAAIQGTREVSVPVIFGVLTTVAAFMPMVLGPGELGQVFGTIGIVVIWCLFFSVVESQLILPAHLGHMKVEQEEVDGEGASSRWKRVQRRFSSGLERLAEQRYRPALERALEWRYATVSLGIATLILTVALLATGQVLQFTFFPPVESDSVTARLTMPLGTPVERTGAAITDLESAAFELQQELEEEYGEPLVARVLALVGQYPGEQRTPLDRGGPVGAPHLGGVTIELVTGDARPLSTEEVAQRWRARAPAIVGAEELVFRSSLFSAGDPIDIQLQAVDIGMLEQAAERVKQQLAGYAGVLDIADTFRAGKEEIKLAILPEAESLGLTLDDLAGQVRQAFYGEEAQRIQRGRDDIRVMVRYPEAQRRSLADLENLRIRTPDGGEVPFYAVARAERGRGYASIRRSDRRRVVRVTADIDRGRANANVILREIEREFLPILLADHPGLSYSLEGEQSEQRETLAGLARNYLFAIIVIYCLLAVPLRSYSQPLIIMAVIPFGLVGAIFGHIIMKAYSGITFNMMSVFGVVALSGVVVNASLVLVHYINSCRERGVSLEQAVKEAGVARFRPIVLTSLTTFAGLLPLLREPSVSAQFLVPMATSLAFGVVFATVISLFLVPSGYIILEDIKGLWRPEKKPALAPVEPLHRGDVAAGGERRR